MRNPLALSQQRIHKNNVWICSKLAIKPLEQGHWLRSDFMHYTGVSIDDFKQVYAR